MLADELASELAFARRFPAPFPRPSDAIIYGAGNGGRQFLHHHAHTPGVHFRAFVDDDPLKHHASIEGLAVCPTEILRGFTGIVIVALAQWQPAERRLRQLAVQHWIYSHDFPSHLAPLPGENPAMGQDHFDAPALLDAWDRLEWLDTVLADKFSRETLRAILRYRLTRRVSCVRPATYREYQHPLVRAQPGDEVIDAGAFDGDTAALFLQTMGDRHDAGRIHAFEPSPENFRRLHDRIARDSLQHRILPVPAALGAADGETTFLEDASSPVASRIAVDAPTRVKIRSLDSYCDQHRISPTLIKLDIEGAEHDALRGAQSLIRRSAPKLQICLYHHAPDLWQLPALIKSLHPTYRLYLGHHAPHHWSDLILYAR